MFHVYQLHEDSPTSEELEEEEHITAAHHWLLPSGTTHGPSNFFASKYTAFIL